MNRAVAVYVAMIVFLVGGLWAILAVGSALEAPTDLSGKWQLSPVGPDAWGPGMDVEQSGRFFQIFIEGGPRLDVEQAGDVARRIVLQNSKYKVSFDGGAPDEKQLRIDGPEGGQWTAKRVSRRYPPDVWPKATAASTAPPSTAPAHAMKEAH